MLPLPYRVLLLVRCGHTSKLCYLAALHHKLMETPQILGEAADFRLLPETNQYLSKRTQHLLLRGGLLTAEQLMLATTTQLMNLHNFGAHALGEVAKWREALMVADERLFEATLNEVVDAMDATMSVLSRRRAAAAMAKIWELISRSPFTATHIRQMLISPVSDD